MTKTIQSFQRMKSEGELLRMMTCYDHWTAKILNETQLDILLVGDSAAMVMHGFPDTISADLSMMELHTRAVRRGAPNKFVVSDIPFLDFRRSLDQVVTSVRTLMVAGANAVKVEGAAGNLEKIRHVVESGVPVMGHLGLTPQFHNQLGGFKVQGRSESEKDRIYQDSIELGEAGVFALVLECVPSDLARTISEKLKIPVIGIGAGAEVDGQVLVLQDMLGANSNFRPKFVRAYENLEVEIKSSVNEYCSDVKSRSFPSKQERYDL